MITLPTPHDPALEARTFSHNPTLTAALERIRQRKALTPSVAPVNTGAEVPGGDDAHPPTEDEMNEHYAAMGEGGE
jgi:hypothetical protein